MRTARFRSLCFAFSIAASLPLLAQADAIGDLDDAAARIQYSFHTADVRGIEQALASLGPIEMPDTRKGMKEYYTAYAYWKLAELHTDSAAAGQRGARSSAVKAASACEDAAADATKVEPAFAEAHAIHAICSTLASRAPNVLTLGGCIRDKSLRTARELEPANLRVRLIEAQCMLEDHEDAAGMLGRIRALVDGFDAAPPASPGRPDWGHAEACLLLARLQLQQGNRVAARDAVERALVLAPDYRAAQELLKQIAGSR